MDKLIVARYNEDVSWLDRIPKNIEVTIINKGRDIRSRDFCIIRRSNKGREADSYLSEMSNLDRYDYKIFCQGNPFDHNPNFLNDLKERNKWDSRFIPLGGIWGDYGSSKNKMTKFNIKSLAPVGFQDKGSGDILNEYRRLSGTRNSSPKTFLENTLDLDLVKSYASSKYGWFTYGAMFAVDEIPFTQNQILSMLREARSNRRAPYLFERFWFHIFGGKFA